MTNGEGSKLREWLIIAGLLVSLGFSVFASARDTPTRSEMENKDSQLELRIGARVDKVDRRLENIEAKQDQMLLILSGMPR